MTNKCTIKVAYGGKSVALLTWTSTMSCWSFGLPAGKHGACPFMEASSRDNICSGCYAQINRYNMPNVLEAQHIRFNWLRERLLTQSGRKEIVDTFNRAIRKYVINGYFRFFDSGDIFSPTIAQVCYEICKANPAVAFWFPTRVYSRENKRIPSGWAYYMDLLSQIPNVSIRPSALSYNDDPPKVDHYAAGTTVLTDGNSIEGVEICKKSEYGGTCESNNCRVCWDSRDTAVGYKIHGYLGRDSIPVISDKILELRKSVALSVKGKAYVAAG